MKPAFRRSRWLVSLLGSLTLGLIAPGGAQEPDSSAWLKPGLPLYSGGFTGGYFTAGTEWQTMTYEGLATEDDDQAFIQINLATKTGSVWLGQIRLETRSNPEAEWQPVLAERPAEPAVWNQRWRLVQRNSDYQASAIPEELDGETALRVDLAKLGANPWDVQVVSRGGLLHLRQGNQYRISVRLRAAAEKWSISSYLMRQEPLRFYAASGDNQLFKTGELAYAEGVRIFAVCLTLPWPKPGEPVSFMDLDYKLGQLIRLFPELRLIIRFGVNPPAWWRGENPDELIQWENGRKSTLASPASAKWRSDLATPLHAFVAHLEAKWGSHILAYHPHALSTGEWYYPIWEGKGWGDLDFSPAFRQGYQEYLRTKYGPIAGLNAAWNARLTEFGQVKIPTGEERRRTAAGSLRNPATQRELIDFSEYLQVAVAEALDQVAQAIKSVNPQKTVCAFYGYTFELPGCQNGIGEAGQLRLGPLLRHSSVDAFVSITSYANRGLNGTEALMAPLESFALHAKHALVENDHRTHLAPVEAGFFRTRDSQETATVLLRDYLCATAHRAQMWLFDLYGQGWYRDPELWRKLGRAGRELATGLEASPPAADVAVIIDEKSLLALAPGIALTKPLLSQSRFAVNSMGTTSASYLLEDFLAGLVPPHKLTVFLNAFWLDGAQRQTIGEQLARAGGTALWLYAPGYLTDSGFSADAVKELTGFDVKVLPPDRQFSQIVFADTAASRVFLATPPAPLACPPDVSLLLSVTDTAGVTPLAHYAASSQIAAAAIRRPGFTSIFLAVPALQADLLASLAAAAGAHLYTEPGPSVIADREMLAVFAPRDYSGPINLPAEAQVSDIFTGESFAARSFKLDLPKGTIKCFRIESKEPTAGRPASK